MFLTTAQIYLWLGLLILGLADLYLARYPMFHPLVLVSVAGFAWGDLSTGLIVAGILELIFGIAQLMETRKSHMVLYAGGLAIYLNQQTYNINLILCISIGLVLGVILQLGLDRVKEWIKWVIIFGVSGLTVFVIPLGKDLFGLIPAELLNQIAVAGEVLPWIVFAYALVGLIGKKKNKETQIAIPAILAGSILNLRGFVWGPFVFVFLYYLLDALLHEHEWKPLWWIDLGLLLVGVYFLIPNFINSITWVFLGLLIFNILLVARDFAPLEIYLLIFIAGIILSRAKLLY